MKKYNVVSEVKLEGVEEVITSGTVELDPEAEQTKSLLESGAITEFVEETSPEAPVEAPEEEAKAE